MANQLETSIIHWLFGKMSAMASKTFSLARRAALPRPAVEKNMGEYLRADKIRLRVAYWRGVHGMESTELLRGETEVSSVQVWELLGEFVLFGLQN